MIITRRRAGIVVAMSATFGLLFACGAFGTESTEAPASDAGADGSTEDATDASTVPTCVTASLDPLPPANPYCDGDAGPKYDLTSTDQHCGSCGHSCRGTGCFGSRCAVTEILSLDAVALGGVPIFANLDLDQVHYADGRTIKRLTPDAGGFETLGVLPGTANYVPALDSDTSRIVGVVPNAGIYALSFSGVVTPIETSGEANNVVLAGGGVYWTHSTGAGIDRVAPGATGSTRWVSTLGAYFALTRDAENVYWLVRPKEADGGPSPLVDVRMSPIAPAASVTIRTSFPDGNGLTAKDGYLYWIDIPNGSVFRASTGGKEEPVQIARFSQTNLRALRGFAVDATHVYWAISETDLGGIMLFKAPKCGGPITLMAEDNMAGGGLATDAEFVYYGHSAKIARIAK